MPLTRMPDGSYVDIADGTAPEVIAKISSQYAAKAPSRATPKAMSADERDVAEGVSSLKRGEGKGLLGHINRTADSMVHEATFHADDVLSSGINAGIEGGKRALKTGDISEVGRVYKNSREALRQYRSGSQDEHPVDNIAGGVAGVVMNPIGAGTKAVGAGLRAAESIAARDLSGHAARALTGILENGATKTFAKAANSGVGLAARTGFNQAAATGLMDTGNVNNAIDQGLVGGAFGAAGGAALSGGTALLRGIKDRTAGEASRVAYEKVADMLARAPRNGGGKYTPASAVREMNVAAARGSDPMLMDLSPEMRAAGGHLARKPGLTVANEMVNAAEARAAGAADRFDAEVMRLADPPNKGNGFARKNEITAQRKAQGAIDYAPGGPMDKAVRPTKDLREFMNNPTPIMESALKDARIRAANDRMPFVVSGTGLPNMRGFDFVKRAMDAQIEKALSGTNPDADLARQISRELTTLKGHLAKANPKYGDILARQRDAFQKKSSVELGQSFLQRMRTQPRELLEEMKTTKINKDELRTGMADALLAMRNSAENPVQAMRKFMRSAPQRAVLEHALGGSKQMNLFDRYMRRELRSAQTDKIVGTGSMSHTLQQQGDELDDVGNVASNVLRGQAFGGVTGALSGAVRSIDALRRGMGPAAQEELGRILTGRGEGLKRGVEDARAFAANRRARFDRRAKLAGKLPAAATSGYAKD